MSKLNLRWEAGSKLRASEMNMMVEAINAKAEDAEMPIIPEGLATEEWVEGKGYLTEHQSLADYAKAEDIPDINGLASEEFVRGEVAKVEVPDVTGFMKEDGVKAVVAAELAGHLAEAGEKFAKLQEVAAWIESDPTGAAALQGAISELQVAMEKAVKFLPFVYGGQNRQTIQLANHDTISGIGADCREGQPNGYAGGENLEGQGFNLVMLSKWNIADFGSAGVSMNLNSKGGIVKINDSKVVATMDKLDALEARIAELEAKLQ